MPPAIAHSPTSSRPSTGSAGQMTARRIATDLVRLVDTVLLRQAGYLVLVPALVLVEIALCVATIRKVPFTEIDFQTYVQQANLFLDGQTNYAYLDPPGGSGPCVYPAGHIYLFSAFSYLTRSGQDLLPAQAVFGAFMILTFFAIAALYRAAAAPPLLLIPLVLTKRIHSVFLLRMFNDPLALFLAYASFVVAQRNAWRSASLVFSLALSIKMNVLLFLPAFAAALFLFAGFVGLLQGLALILAAQVALAWPFIAHDPASYLAYAFNLSRQFEYRWTVNWRFVDEDTFLSRPFSLALLGVHLSLLVGFGLFRWTGLGRKPFSWLKRRWSKTADDGRMSQDQARDLLLLLFTANLVGIVCSRSLHYQFYSWYFHQIPFLLWQANLPLPIKFVLPAAIEWSWNVFPSTNASSGVLLASHLIMLAGLWTSRSYGPDTQLSIASDGHDAETKVRPATVAGNQDVEDDLEVERLVTGKPRAPTAEVDPATKTTEPEAPAEDLSEDGEEDDDVVDEEDALIKTFRKRIAVRKKVVGAIGRAMPTIRRLLVVAALALLFVIPDPHSPLSKGVYVDENALQPGQAQVYWDYFDVTYADMVSEKVDRIGRFGDRAARAELIRSELASYGLQAHLQNYSYPAVLVAPAGEDPEARTGTNVYARSPSPRIDGREAIIISASWRSRWRGQNDPFSEPDAAAQAVDRGLAPRRINVRGIASLLVLARYLSTQNFLSKDLIFVVSDGYLEGINAWSSAYFDGRPGGAMEQGDRDTAAFAPIHDGGSQVWNALSLDYPSDSFSKLALLYEGIDGQLPNMDSLNTLLKIAERVGDGVPVSLYGEVESFEAAGASKQSWLKPLLDLIGMGWVETRMYEDGLRAALHQMRHGATGQTTGAHGVFQRHHIDAFTVFAVPARGPYGFYHLGRIVESYVRSMSNLLERLHHSQFLYLLVSSRRFVPIGVAILVPLLLSISMTLSGLAAWYREEERSLERKRAWRSRVGLDAASVEGVDADADVDMEEPSEWQTRGRCATLWIKHGKAAGGLAVKEIEAEVERLQQTGRPWKAAVALLVAAISSGALVLAQLRRSDIELGGLSGNTRIAVLAATLFMPAPLAALVKYRSHCAADQLRPLLRTVTLLYSGMTIAVLATVNVSLATFLALVLVVLHAPLPSALMAWALSWALNPLVIPLLVGAVDAAGQVTAPLETALYDWRVTRSRTVDTWALIWWPVAVIRAIEAALALASSSSAAAASL
ncbi:uncharacterized protein PFL1_06651 [Pseudozyma flocculosa PF-1]|uniref:Dol-P-Man:Man(5)GlcNAc(2)-PP-Dol alpha-1,3-mannosyltransferase n=2 Tax=Pseudozyma flocculosa TaxID=84751 RepID=A0A5C3F7R1_9BASI|nr:uncharacterized protein PFL1_06651 [Pseudozyma flocculosa PF-1]EPQ25784.1 hypothetical protein PFL1_06651 [Pseudozyma flocculosa PF-1]SPO40518.1 related to Alpha-1,3-mannosyltransferase [Pseudozyma flocculosa]